MRHNLRTFWRLSLLRTRFPLDNRLQAMLSEKQMKLVASQVNEDLNIPVFSESSEGAMIMELVQRIAPQIEPSLKVFLPLVYVECIRIALSEGMSPQDRRRAITKKLQAELEEPLAKELNSRVDCSFVPEDLEGKALTVASAKIIKKMVEWTVGELQEKLDEEYAEAGL